MCVKLHLEFPLLIWVKVFEGGIYVTVFVMYSVRLLSKDGYYEDCGC